MHEVPPALGFWLNPGGEGRAWVRAGGPGGEGEDDLGGDEHEQAQSGGAGEAVAGEHADAAGFLAAVEELGDLEAGACLVPGHPVVRVASACVEEGVQELGAHGDTKSERSCMWHAPDYFVRLADGGARVVDVRAEDDVDERTAEAFAATERACSAVGWEFAHVGVPDPVVMANLRWLARYRHGRCGRETDVAERLVEVFRQHRASTSTSSPGGSCM